MCNVLFHVPPGKGKPKVRRQFFICTPTSKPWRHICTAACSIQRDDAVSQSTIVTTE